MMSLPMNVYPVESMLMSFVPSVFLGYAQLDKLAEVCVLNPDSKEQLIFVTLEWITKPSNQMKIHSLAHADKLLLIVIDETHLYTKWNEC